MQTEKANPQGVRNTNNTQIDFTKLYNSQDIIAQMQTRIKGLIFILDNYIIRLEADKCFKEQHIYLQSGISNLNTLLDLLLEDNSKLENNQQHIDEMLKKTE